MHKKIPTVFWPFLLTIIFAAAFALIEAVVVVYLRSLFGFEQEYLLPKSAPLVNFGFIAFLPSTRELFPGRLITIEMLREAATIVVLVVFVLLSAKNAKGRLGAFITAFSLWDIFYYLFLRLLSGWPTSFFDIDVFFLIPFPWTGPVATPLVIFGLLLPVGVYLYLSKNSS